MSETATPPLINLAKVSQDDLVSRDIFGRTILHLLILTNRYDLLRNLLKNAEVKQVLSAVDYENGWNCFHYAIFHKKLSCFKVLVEYFRSSVKLTLLASLMELLKAKDRNGLTPFQLLDNDFKDLMWIPEYIDENDEIFLVKRWQEEEVPEAPEGSDVVPEDVRRNAPQTPTEGEAPRDAPRDNTAVDIKPNIVKKPNHIPYNPRRGGSEIYMYGSNSNHQLGLGDSKDRSTPSRLSHIKFKADTSSSIQDTFRKPRYNQIAISKNHSVVTTTNGEIFSCGIGSRGRLGNDLNDKFRYEKIELENVTRVKISKNHSLALTSNNELYSWGLNSFNQLGYSSTGKNFLDRFESSPFLVTGELRKSSKPILGISCSKIHSLAFTSNEIYSWGLNIGQMGFPALHQDIEFKFQNLVCKGEIQPAPKCITMRDEIKFVDTCELYTVVVTKKNDVHIYYQYQHYKLPKIQSRGEKSERERKERDGTKSHFDIFKPTCLTKPIQIIKLVSKSNDFCTLLLDNGDVISFKFNANDVKSTKYNTVWKAYDKDMIAIDFDVGFDGSIILCTRNGSVFVRSKATLKLKGNLAEILPTPNKFRKLENLNKVVKVTCDGNFLSFGFIRDDIDFLPLKLKKNDFFEDLQYLSCLEAESDERKQLQLIQGDGNESYVTRFIYPQETDMDDSVPDLLHNKLLLRYTGETAPNLRDTYQTCKGVDDIRQILSDNSYTLKTSKDFDCFITFKQDPKVSIGVHRHILRSRSPTFNTIFNLSDTEKYYSSDFEATYQGNKIVIQSPTSVASILILLHFIYCSKVCDIWSAYPSRHLYPPHIKKVKDEYDELVQIFRVKDILSQMEGFMNTFQDWDEGDVVFELKDGEMRGFSYLLKSRSAFFETVLRWSELEDGNESISQESSFNEQESDSSLDGTISAFAHRLKLSEPVPAESVEPIFKSLNFNGLTVLQFTIVLRHIYGCSDSDIFNHFQFKFEESDDFINELLELIEISDELLLFQLKALCQLAIIDFISLENVVILLTHADYLSAPKLFLNCCWYIYNNLEVLLFDVAFLELPFDILKKLEKQVEVFQGCKLIDFVENGKSRESYNWFENKSNLLMGQFMSSKVEFNEQFISDRKGCSAFEPLVDVKFEGNKAKDGKKRTRKSRKSSTLNTDIADFRNSIAVEREADSVVVEEVEEFEVVKKGGRRKSRAERMSQSPPPSNSSPTIPKFGSTPPSRNSSVVGINNGVFSSLSQARDSILTKDPPAKEKSSVEAGISPYSNWASKSYSTPILNDKSSGVRVSPSLNGSSSSDYKKLAKVKIGPMVKLSQKERKKLAAAPVEVPEEVFRNPWSVGTLSTSSLEPPDELPVLGASRDKKKKSVRSNSATKPIEMSRSYSDVSKPAERSSLDAAYTPSLTEIMIEESLKVERAKIQESERKTLLEIQQEQEFARWWEEETQKVQKQMGLVNLTEESGTTKKAGKKKKRTEKAPKKKTKEDV